MTVEQSLDLHRISTQGPKSSFKMLSDKKDSKMNLGGSVRINPTRVDVICVILLLHFNSGFSCVTRDTRHVPSAPVDSTQNTSSSSVDPAQS